MAKKRKHHAASKRGINGIMRWRNGENGIVAAIAWRGKAAYQQQRRDSNGEKAAAAAYQQRRQRHGSENSISMAAWQRQRHQSGHQHRVGSSISNNRRHQRRRREAKAAASISGASAGGMVANQRKQHGGARQRRAASAKMAAARRNGISIEISASWRGESSSISINSIARYQRRAGGANKRREISMAAGRQSIARMCIRRHGMARIKHMAAAAARSIASWRSSHQRSIAAKISEKRVAWHGGSV